MGLDFIDRPDGFLFFRIAGPETTVNAVQAYLSRHDPKRHKHDSKVLVWPAWGKRDPAHVMTEKGWRYRTIRKRLPSGAVDLAMIHPRLTLAEDKKDSFLLLTYDSGVPVNFFSRLNRILPIPLRPEWASWLWEIGQQSHTWRTLIKRQVYQDGDYVLKDELVEETRTPITEFESLGKARCYEVLGGGLYEECWLQIVRKHLGLGRCLDLVREGTNKYYTGDDWLICPSPDKSTWVLSRQGLVLLEDAPTPSFLVAKAHRELGQHLVISES